MLSSDIAEMVAHHVRGFDHVAEAVKVEEHGAEAAAARLQFRPRTLPAAGEKPEATGFLLEGIEAQGEPFTAYGGVYRVHPHQGRYGYPLLMNAAGMCCSAGVLELDEIDGQRKWGLDNDWMHISDCVARIDAPDGPQRQTLVSQRRPAEAAPQAGGRGGKE